jgi:hypothetical protein
MYPPHSFDFPGGRIEGDKVVDYAELRAEAQYQRVMRDVQRERANRERLAVAQRRERERADDMRTLSTASWMEMAMLRRYLESVLRG